MPSGIGCCCAFPACLFFQRHNTWKGQWIEAIAQREDLKICSLFTSHKPWIAWSSTSMYTLTRKKRAPSLWNGMNWYWPLLSNWECPCLAGWHTGCQTHHCLLLLILSLQVSFSSLTDLAILTNRNKNFYSWTFWVGRGQGSDRGSWIGIFGREWLSKGEVRDHFSYHSYSSLCKSLPCKPRGNCDVCVGLISQLWTTLSVC